MPISALTKAFRMECTLRRVATSPNSATMRPATTIETASESMVAAWARAAASRSADQPSSPGEAARSQDRPGTSLVITGGVGTGGRLE